MKARASRARSGSDEQRLEEIAPRVRPASDFEDRAVFVQVVVDRVGIGDQIALVAGEELVDGGAIVPGRVAVEHVSSGHDDDPEVAATTLVLRLHEHAGRVGAQIGRRLGVTPHGRDQRLDELGELLVPAAQRRAGQVHAFALVDLLESMQRQVILESLHRRVGKQPRTREPTLDGQVDRIGHVKFRRGIALPIFAQKLGPVDVQGHQRGPPTLEDHADLAGQLLEGVETLALDLFGDQVDVDPRQVLGQRPAPLRLAPRVPADLLGRGFARGVGGRRARLVRVRSRRALCARLEQRAQQLKRQLGVRGRQTLGLLPEQTPLEPLAALEHVQVEPSIVLALGRRLRVVGLELVEAFDECGELGHRVSK